MPCSDSSSSMTLQLDSNEQFVNFEYAKISCGREITAKTGYVEFCQGMPAEDILALQYNDVQRDLEVRDEETQFILYLEWEALRAALAQYLGKTDIQYDQDRCQITSVDVQEEGIEVALVILPPRAMPKILPCNLGNEKEG